MVEMKKIIWFESFDVYEIHAREIKSKDEKLPLMENARMLLSSALSFDSWIRFGKKVFHLLQKRIFSLLFSWT